MLQLRVIDELVKALSSGDAAASALALINDAGTYDVATGTGGFNGSLRLECALVPRPMRSMTRASSISYAAGSLKADRAAGLTLELQADPGKNAETASDMHGQLPRPRRCCVSGTARASI